MPANWTKIRNAYINSSMSLAEIAKKYKVSLSETKAHSGKEKWSQLRKEQQTKIGLKLAQKTADIKADQEATRIAKIREVNDALLDAALESARQLDKIQLRNKKQQRLTSYNYGGPGETGKPVNVKEVIHATEDVEVKQTIIDVAKMRQVAATLATIADTYEKLQQGSSEEIEDDGLIKALNSRPSLFSGCPDDSDKLPAKDDES